LEHEGLLNRAVEFLPTDAELAERKNTGKGLVRPELAVVLAYAKLWLYEKMLASKLPEDPVLQQDAIGYFPKALRGPYAKDIAKHHLRREIAATVATNDIVNRTGINAILTIADKGDIESVVRAYILARDALGLPELWSEIEALDGKIDANAQIRLMISIKKALSQAMDRLLTNRDALKTLDASVKAYRKAIEQLNAWLTKTASNDVKNTENEAAFEGVPETLAQRVARLSTLVEAFDVIALSTKNKASTSVSDLAAIFFGLRDRLEIGWLCRTATKKAQTAKQREIVAIICDKLAAHHRRLTAQIAAKKGKDAKQALATWTSQNEGNLKPYASVLARCHATETEIDIALLLTADERLGDL
jgi:glutamate dehydrogenase